MDRGDYIAKNRAYWNRTSKAYQSAHGAQIDWRISRRWGVWNIPESELRVLGDVRGKDVLEFGCGAAQWSIAFALGGARPVGLDVSEEQLTHARVLMTEAGVEFPLLCASAESVRLPDASFDIVFCDHGAITFADPHKSVPEAARLLRRGGAFAFNMASPFVDLCWSENDKAVSFNLPYGAWIRLFRRCGFVVEDLIELRPPADATTSYTDYVGLEWARRRPAENIWKLRRA